MEQYTDKPIFLFSASWRSGSTLLQRLITASSEALIWGEAGGALDCLADTEERYAQMLGLGDVQFKHGFGGNGAEQFEQFVAAGAKGVLKWIACMNPQKEVIHKAFREMFDKIYAESSLKLGYSRWGIKEVRAGINAAIFLKKLYPDAKFVFLIRNPLSCLLSMKRRNWVDCISTKDPLSYYAKSWRKLAAEFRKVEFGYIVRYEELITKQKTLESLFEYLEISKVPSNFITKSRVDWETLNNEKLTYFEKLKIRIMIGDEMAHYGYTMDLK